MQYRQINLSIYISILGEAFLAEQFFLFIDILLKLQQPILICFCKFGCNSVVIEDLLILLV